MCHMGSERKVRQRATELVQELCDIWYERKNDILRIICPFVKELEDVRNKHCRHTDVEMIVCHSCLGDYDKCSDYLNKRHEVNAKIDEMIELLTEHYTEYLKREGD